jgi:hypothetical protein
MAFNANYLFVRTERSFADQSLSLEPLCRELDSPVSVLCINGEMTWQDGAVIRFYSSESVEDCSTRLKPHLCPFDLWSLHDSRGNCSEHFGGIVGKYYRSNPSTKEHTQVFITYPSHVGDNDVALQAISREIREESERVFHFRFGCILMLQPSQPLNLLANRFDGKALRRFVHSAAVTRGGETLTAPLGPPPWRKLV